MCDDKHPLIVPPENCDLALRNFCAILTFYHDSAIFVVECNFHATLATFVRCEAVFDLSGVLGI